ncbi:MAG TPA: hypothetical protein VGL97_14840, partial [Bryobacteraceae bacterium]
TPQGPCNTDHIRHDATVATKEVECIFEPERSSGTAVAPKPDASTRSPLPVSQFLLDTPAE